MNLGEIYLKAFACIVVISLLFSVASLAWLRYWRFAWQSIVLMALPIWLIVGFLALDNLHYQLFAFWHRQQNRVLPSNGCLTYQPEFYRLHATYALTPEEFESWVRNHPWAMHPASNELLATDGPRLGFDHPEMSWETDAAPNGRQLRVYFKSGIMYVAYNSN